jgi:hypothetical protein
MANRKNTFLIKRSNTPGKIPTAGDLLLGELALNTADVILYASGTTANSILPIGWDRVARTGDTMTGPLYGTIFSGATVSGNTLHTYGTIFYNQSLPSTPAAGTIELFSFNHQGFSTIHHIDSTGAVLEAVRDNLCIIRNNTGASIAKGSVVFVTGATGSVPTIGLSKADSINTLPALGILFETTGNNSFGRVMLIGNIENINLSAYNTGDLLYVSPTVAGGLTNIKPTYPNYAQSMGVVLNNGVGNGVLQVFTRVVEGIDTSITGATFINNNLILTNNTGGTVSTLINTFTGLTATTISAATYYNLPTTTDTNAFHNSGDTFGVNASLGTNDAYPLLLKTSGTTRMVIGNDGYVGINSPTTIPDATLYVKGIGSNYQYAFQLVGPSGNNIMTAFNIGQINFGAGSNTTYFDDYRLRVGGAPGVNAGTLTTKGVDSTASYYGFNVYNANQDDLFNVRNDGRISVNGNLVVTGSTSVNSISATTINLLNGIGTSISLLGIDSTGKIVSGATINTFSGSFGITIDGAGSVITTGVKGYAVIPYNATITGYDIIGNTSGSCAVDIWKSTSVPTSANTITGSEIPSLTNQQLNSDNSLTTWTTGIFINDIIAFNVISASTVSRINLIVKVIKT